MGNNPYGGHGCVCEGGTARVGVSHAMVYVKILCFTWLSPFLKPSPRLMLCGWFSSSIDSLIIRSKYQVLAERIFVPCSLIMWSWIMLCSATVDLSVCTSLMCLLYSLIWTWLDRPLYPKRTLRNSHRMLFTPGVPNHNASLAGGR